MTEQWMQILSLFIANAALIVWFRAESRNDWRHMDAKVDAIKDLTASIQVEMRSFHGRLCAIEKNRNRRG